FDVENYCEIDKYASRAYSAIHDIKESKNLLDVTKIKNYNAHIDILTYGFPCQDISNAGKQKGFLSDGEKTRSGLVFDALRIINDCKPKICICENVKALTS
ncbi:DNA cytosine methyltransferase, partial [Anaerosporobacter sp.]